MPLDSMLAENFHAAYRQKRSGVLTAEGATIAMRFCFQDGSPIAIDLGDAKDRLLAYTLRTYNRLDEQQMAAVLAAWEAGQASVADVAVAHGYASEEEVARSTQAMVEDGLCRFFAGKVTQVSFDDQKTIDGFDFDRQAFRLKIDAEVLLRTVETKIGEIHAIEQQFPGFTAIFGFNEDSPGSGQLSEAEKAILNHVDGKATIHEVAALYRDSELSTARMLTTLEAKKVIRRVDADAGHTVQTTPIGGGTGMRQAITEATGGNSAARAAVAQAAMQRSQPTMRDFTPYRQVEQPPQNRFMTVVLGLVLVLLCAIGALIWQYRQKVKEFEAAVARLEESIGKGEWADARQQIEEARVKAGQDLSVQQKIGELDDRLNQAIDSELKAIEKLSADGDHRQAGTRLSRLPSGEKVDAMRAQVARAEAVSRKRAQELADRIQELVDHDDGAGAANLIVTSPLLVREKDAAEEAIGRWRVTKLELANSSTAPYGKRVAAITRLRASEPPARIVDQLVLVDADIKRQEGRLREQLSAFGARLDKGEIDPVAADIERLDLPAQLEGTPLGADLGRIRGRIAEVRDTVAGLLKNSSEALVAIEAPDRLDAANDEAAKLTTSPLAGVAAKATVTRDLLTEVRKISRDQGPDLQAAALAPLQETKGLDPALTEALHRRVDRLKALEGAASTSLDSSRALARDGKFEEAVKALDQLISRTEFHATLARATALQEIDELKARLTRREALKDKLKAAIARGDVAEGTNLAREMGLKYLPLSIESLPSGAEVWHDGKQVGTTPMVLDISAAERVDYEIELRVPGYLAATASGAKAEAGWRLLVKLERQPASTASLGGLVTSHPTVIDGRLVAASRSALGMLDAAGTATWIAFGKEAVDSPLYAEAIGTADELLLSTRNQVALVVAKGQVRRAPLAGRSDFALAVHHSTLIDDRRYVLLAGLDGAVHATDDRDPQVAWQGPTGAPFLTGPAVVGDVVVTVRKDGALDRIQADDGKPLSGESLGQSVVAAWTTPTGVAGYTANERFEYDGTTLVRTPLPQVAVDGVEDLIITPVNRVLVRSATGSRSWDDVGKLDGRLTNRPMVWHGHAVLPLGDTLLVYGPRGFRLGTKSEFLTPVVLNDRLHVVTQDGTVQIFDP